MNLDDQSARRIIDLLTGIVGMLFIIDFLLAMIFAFLWKRSPLRAPECNTKATKTDEPK